MRKRLGCCVLAVSLIGIAAGCGKREDTYPTEWMKLRTITPSSGMIGGGAIRHIYWVKVGGRWLPLGSGNYTSHHVLADGKVVLYDMSDNKGLHIIREDERQGRRVADAFAPGDVRVVPYKEDLDIFDCSVRAEPAGCREVTIRRFELSGKPVESFSIALPKAYSDCQLLRIDGYDRDYIPYLFGQCAMDAPQKCVFVAPRKDGLWVHAVGLDEPWIKCSSAPPGVGPFIQ